MAQLETKPLWLQNNFHGNSMQLYPKSRKPVWIALSELYLDIELDEHDFIRFANLFHDSGYTLAEVMEINKYEVAPVLRSNLLSPAGVWTGFDKKWLITACAKNYQRRNKILFRFLQQINFCILKPLQEKYWQQIQHHITENAPKR